MTDITLEDKMVTAIHNYVKYFSEDDAQSIIDLYAETATVEDPIGSEPIVGKEGIKKFYEYAVSMSPRLSLQGDIRFRDNEAAFAMKVMIASSKIEIDVIDTMKFDIHGKIIQMRAFWGDRNITPLK